MGKLKTRKRYRLTFVNENTFNAVWTLRLSRLKVWVLSGLCVAAIAALVLVFMVWTPLSGLLPGYLKPSQREINIENALRVDSLLTKAENQRRYMENIAAILGDTATAAAADSAATADPEEIIDTLLAASQNEREFVRSWAEREKNSLSVLTPVVAEGMMFRLPAAGAEALDDGSGFRLPRNSTATSVTEGTVVSVTIDAATGRATAVVQHANDFISVTGGLKNVFVEPGQRIAAGQALGQTDETGLLPLGIWHQGRHVRLSALLPVSSVN